MLQSIQQGIENEEVLAKGFYEGLVEAMAETANPFIGESIFTEAIGDIVARGGRTKDGVNYIQIIHQEMKNMTGC